MDDMGNMHLLIADGNKIENGLRELTSRFKNTNLLQWKDAVYKAQRPLNLNQSEIVELWLKLADQDRLSVQTSSNGELLVIRRN